MTDIDYAARVAKGVALLDVKWPGWATEIDVDTLDVAEPYRCVTAQYANLKIQNGSYFATGMRALGLEEGEDGSYVAHGFNVEGDYDENVNESASDAHDTLNALWKGVIAERRAAADTPTEGAS